MLDDQSLPKQSATDHDKETPRPADWQRTYQQNSSQDAAESLSSSVRDPGQSEAWQHRVFVELRQTIEEIRRHLATSDVNQTESHFDPSANVLDVDLQQMDPALPHQTFGEVLIACEALALVSGPSALVSGDAKALHSQSRGLQATMLGILRVSQAGTTEHPSISQPVSGAQDALIAALRQPAMVADLLRMTELLGALAADTPAIAGIQVAALPSRPLAPIFIIGLAIALILFLAGSILIATSRIPPTQHGRNTGSQVAGNVMDTPTPQPTGHVTGGGALPTATSIGQPQSTATATSGWLPPSTATATSGGQPPPTATATSGGQPPPTATATSGGLPPPTATATSGGLPPPAATATATPVPLPPPPPPTQAPAINVSLSAQSLQLCPDNDVTIAYNSGNGVINWTMTVSDSTNIGVHDVDGAPYYPSVSGQLAPGQSVDVAVKALNDGNFSGVLTLHIPGLHDQYVSYQTNCLSSGN